MDAAGFEAFYAATSQQVTRQVYLMVSRLPEAQHAVHVAYARAWRSWDKVSRLADPQAWVRRKAIRLVRSRRHRLLRALRGRGRRIPTEALVFAARDEAVIEALRRLPDSERDAVVLHHLVGLDVPALAAETGYSPKAAWARLTKGRATLASLLPHLLTAPAPAAAAQPGATGSGGSDDALRRYLLEAAERRHPVLLPAPDVRKRRWRRRYYTVTATTVVLATGVAAASVAAAVGLRDLGTSLEASRKPGPTSQHASPQTEAGSSQTAAGPTSAEPSPSDPPPATPTPSPTDGQVTPTPGGTFKLGSTTAKARGIPRNRKDLGFIAGWVGQDGGTFLRFDRARLRPNGTIENDSKLVRKVPLAASVTVKGGSRLPAELSMAELVWLMDAGAVREVPFVLLYDANDQVAEVRELLDVQGP